MSNDNNEAQKAEVKKINHDWILSILNDHKVKHQQKAIMIDTLILKLQANPELADIIYDSCQIGSLYDL